MGEIGSRLLTHAPGCALTRSACSFASWRPGIRRELRSKPESGAQAPALADGGFMVSEKLVVATATAEPFGLGPSCACPDETPMFCVACGDHRRMGARGSQDWPCLPVLWLHRQLVPVSPLP